MLEVEGVSASYGEVTALRNLSMSVQAGETVALIGRNGAGKTTALRLLSGATQPTAGDIKWKGESVIRQPPERRVRDGIVLVPEGRGIFPSLTVEENLRMGAYWRKPRAKSLQADLEEIWEMLPVLFARRKQAAGTLSGGEQQMLAIGGALLAKPEILLLDEPSLGLSPLMVEALYDILRKLKARGMAFVLVEQYVLLALDLCDRAIGLKKGLVVMSGPAEEVAHEELDEVYMGGRDLEAEAKHATIPG